MTFHIFFGGGGVGAAMCLPARVLEDPALGPFDEPLVDSAFGVWAEIVMAGIGVSPLKPEMGVVKLSSTYKKANKE
jgi:hypothetical protein